MTDINLFKINLNRAEKLAEIVSELNYHPVSFDSPDLFPEIDDFIYPNYVFFMVAIDHRTHGRMSFEAEIDRKFYHGSDLMYFLARKAQRRDKYLFTAERLKETTEKDIKRIFSFKSIQIGNPSQRAMLLRDAALKLSQYYGGDIMNLIEKADGYLLRKNNSGILKLLRIFRAYEDPLSKKSYLLVKILKREGYLNIKDRENISLPVDNVLMTVSVRSGLVDVQDKTVRGKVANGEALSWGEVSVLRETSKKVLEVVSIESGIEADILDDLLWTYGREVTAGRKTDEIKTPLDDRIGNKNVFADFIHFIGGFDLSAGICRKLKIPDTWYF